MHAAQLHRLVRALRRVAAGATTDPGESAGAAELAVGEDLFRHAPTSVSEIVHRTGLVQSQVSRVVAAMRAEGLLTAAPDPADGRRTLLSLAPGVHESHGRTRGARDIEPALRAYLHEATGEEPDPERLDAIRGHLDALAGLLEA